MGMLCDMAARAPLRCGRRLWWLDCGNDAGTLLEPRVAIRRWAGLAARVSWLEDLAAAAVAGRASSAARCCRSPELVAGREEQEAGKQGWTEVDDRLCSFDLHPTVNKSDSNQP